MLKSVASLTEGAVVFYYPVKNPEHFSIVAFDEHKNATSIEKKPQKPTLGFLPLFLEKYSEYYLINLDFLTYFVNDNNKKIYVSIGLERESKSLCPL